MPVLDRLSEQERKKISDLFANKASALPSHNTQVKAEQGNPTHTFTRHGYQTGWESQLMRLVTGRTPDQPDDEDGVRDAVVKYREKEAPLLNFKWAETKSKTTTTWVEYDYIDMIVSGPHSLSGVSFTRGKHAKKLVEKDAVQAIEDFIHQKREGPEGSTDTWEDKKKILGIMESVDVAAPYSRSAYRADYKLRFPSMSDLLVYLDVTAEWMKNVNVALRRFGGNDWRIHTAYCVGTTDEPSPTRGGPSVKTGKWTGNLSATNGGAVTFVDPALLA